MRRRSSSTSSTDSTVFNVVSSSARSAETSGCTVVQSTARAGGGEMRRGAGSRGSARYRAQSTRAPAQQRVEGRGGRVVGGQLDLDVLVVVGGQVQPFVGQPQRAGLGMV